MITPVPPLEEQHSGHSMSEPTVSRLVPVGPPGRTEAPPLARPGAPLLELRRGPGAGTTFALPPGTTTLGRHRDCDIALDDAAVSRQHAELRRTGDRIVLRDLGSLNGTYLNRQPCDEAALSDGDEIWVGTFRFTYRAG